MQLSTLVREYPIWLSWLSSAVCALLFILQPRIILPPFSQHTDSTYHHFRFSSFFFFLFFWPQPPCPMRLCVGLGVTGLFFLAGTQRKTCVLFYCSFLHSLWYWENQNDKNTLGKVHYKIWNVTYYKVQKCLVPPASLLSLFSGCSLVIVFSVLVLKLVLIQPLSSLHPYQNESLIKPVLMCAPPI